MTALSGLAPGWPAGWPQDLLALSPRYASRPASEEVINDPTRAKHYWRFRLHAALEELAADGEWCGSIQEMLLLGERAS